MRKFSKYLSLTALTGILSLGGAMNLQANTTLDATQLMDLNGVTDVRVAGSDTRVSFTADPARPTGVTVVDHGGRNCEMVATMTRSGNAMLIAFDLKQGGMGFGFMNRCESNVAVNLAPGTNLDIDLDKVVAQINGAYGNLNVQTEDAVITFDGQAGQMNVNGDKVVANVVLNNVESTDLVRVSASKLVIDLGLAATAQVSYQINAGVALFTRGIGEVVNAATKIEISSDVLKGSTYVDSSAL
jgi:hypothetical protein